MRKILFAAALLISAAPAYAVNWKVDPTTSKLMFYGEQESEKFSGSFSKFDSSIDFDEAAPEKGRIHIVVTMDSLQVEGKDRQDALPSADWLDMKQFPAAEFTSESIRANGSDKIGINDYLATGKLTIHGINKEITLPFWLKTVGKTTEARGEFTLSRKDFNVGQGRWASDEWIKYPVRVVYEIHASAQ